MYHIDSSSRPAGSSDCVLISDPKLYAFSTERCFGFFRFLQFISRRLDLISPKLEKKDWSDYLLFVVFITNFVIFFRLSSMLLVIKYLYQSVDRS